MKDYPWINLKEMREDTKIPSDDNGVPSGIRT
jgi:hypothetical protein